MSNFESIRNIAVVGHSGEGKTTLCEAMLFNAGAIDRMGMLSDITHIVSDDFSINMREIRLRSHDGIFEGKLSLYVQDADSLHALMDKFRQIKGLESVKRIENNDMD